MMTIGDIRAATTVVTTLREDWDHRAVESAISELAGGNYTHADILHACTVIATDRRNMAPVTLSLKAPDLIARAHPTTQRRRGFRPSRTNPGFVCDVCLKTPDVCEAENAIVHPDRAHEFVSVRDADGQRGRPIPIPDLFAMPEN